MPPSETTEAQLPRAPTQALLVWGCGEHGQNGQASLADVSPPAAVPVADIRPKYIACGSSHTCVVTATDEILAWGNGTSGQLGNGESRSTHVPSRVVLQRTGDESPIAGLACGNRFTILWSAAGRCYGFGSNYNAQLGYDYGESEFKKRPVIPRPIIVCSRPVRSVACGSKHSVFVVEDGSLYSCGGGSEGQLGHGTRADESCPRKVTALEGVVISQVACGAAHTVALCSEGTLFMWGNRLACGTTGDVLAPMELEALAEGRCVRVACGGTHSLALAEGGVVYSWGRGQHGQLGHGLDVSAVLKPKALAALQGVRVAYIGAGEWFSVAVAADGAVAYLWGRNTNSVILREEGRVGEARVWEPLGTPAPPGTRFADVACGGWHAAAMLHPLPPKTPVPTVAAAAVPAADAPKRPVAPLTERERRAARYRALMDEPLLAPSKPVVATAVSAPAVAVPPTPTAVTTPPTAVASAVSASAVTAPAIASQPTPASAPIATATAGVGSSASETAAAQSECHVAAHSTAPPTEHPQSAVAGPESTSQKVDTCSDARSTGADAGAATAANTPAAEERRPSRAVRFVPEADASAQNPVVCVPYTPQPRLLSRRSQAERPKSAHARALTSPPIPPGGDDVSALTATHSPARNDAVAQSTDGNNGVGRAPLQRPKSARPRLQMHGGSEGDEFSVPPLSMPSDESSKRVRLQSTLDGVRRLYTRPSAAQEKLIRLLHKFDGDDDADGAEVDVDVDGPDMGIDLDGDVPDSPLALNPPPPPLSKRSSRTIL